MNPKNKFLDFLQPKNKNQPLYNQSSSLTATPIQGRVSGEQGFDITGSGRTTTTTPPASTAPKTIVVPNASATNTTQTKIVPPTTSTLSPAGKQFANTLTADKLGANTYVNNASNYGAVPNPQGYYQAKSYDGQSVPLPTPTTATNTTQTSTNPSATDTAFAEYIKFLTPSARVSEATSAYNTAVADQAKTTAGLEGQGRGISTSIIRGQQEKYLRQTQPELARLQGEISIAQDEQTGLKDVSKAILDYRTGQDKTKTEAEKTAYERTRDTVKDTQTEAKLAQDKLEADRKFNEDVRQFNQQYALDKQKEDRIAKEALDSGKPLTTSQAAALGYANRLSQSKSIIDNIGGKFTGTFANFPLPNQLKSEERQQFEQAKRNFINSVLRRESGAAISESEFDNAEKQYFPMAGDSEAVQAQKKANRDLVYANFLVEAGQKSARSGEGDPLGIR